MLRLLNVAIPAKVPVPVRLDLSPERVSPPGLLPKATVTVGRPAGNDVTRFPNASSNVTSTAGVMMASAGALLGCTGNASCVAEGGVTVPVAVRVAARPSLVPETVLACALLDLAVPVPPPP